MEGPRRRLAELRRIDEALLSFQHALKLKPRPLGRGLSLRIPAARNGTAGGGPALSRSGRPLKPNQHLVLETRALVLHGLKRYEEALADNQRAHELNPGNADTCNNIGASLQFLSRDEEALPWFDRAMALRPGYVLALLNKAASADFKRTGYDEAKATYLQVKAIDPGNPETDWNLSLLYMLTGNFEAGWAMREARWNKANPGVYPKFSDAPMVRRGRDIAGKTIVDLRRRRIGRHHPIRALCADGGRPRRPRHPGGRSAGHALLSGLPGVSQCLRKDIDVLPPFDLHCPMSGLPLAFGTRLDTIPPGHPICLPCPRPRTGLGRPPRPPRQIAGRPGLVRQSRAQQRS